MRLLAEMTLLLEAGASMMTLTRVVGSELFRAERPTAGRRRERCGLTTILGSRTGRREATEGRAYCLVCERGMAGEWKAGRPRGAVMAMAQVSTETAGSRISVKSGVGMGRGGANTARGGSRQGVEEGMRIGRAAGE